MTEREKAGRLTPKMAEALRQLAEPNARARYMPYMGRFNENPYWYICGTGGRSTKQVEGLIERGYVSITSEDWRGKDAKITPAGRSALAALEDK